MHNLTKILLSLIISAASAAVLANHLSEKTISERTAPVGKVYRPGDTIPQAVETASAASAVSKQAPRTGESIYNKACTVCHATGVAGAPIFGNATDWAPRAAKGMAVLLSSALNGKGGMPAKGMCMECSTDEIKSTIEYMLKNSK